MKNAILQNKRAPSSGQQNMAGADKDIPRSLEFIFPLLLILFTLIPYWETATFGFVNFDDLIYVYENPLLHDGLTYPKIHQAIVGFRASNWHPLVWLSFMAEMELFGMKPGVMHITNVVLHIANALLVYLWLRRSTGDAVRSFIAGFIFAAHPLHDESVAWITERNDVLSTLFLMVTLICYTEYSQRNNRKWYGPSHKKCPIGVAGKSLRVIFFGHERWNASYSNCS